MVRDGKPGWRRRPREKAAGRGREVKGRV